MKKSLIALAVAGAFAAPAMADSGNVTLYGQANVSYDMVDNGNITGTQGTRTNKVSSNASRIGLKGSEDLGGGLSAVWQVESTVDIDGDTGAGANTNTLGTRNTFAGLSGKDWGTLVLGRHDTPYKLSTRNLDQFADTIADNRSLMGTGGGVGFDLRTPDTVAYISPNMGGFSAAVAYVAGAEAASLSTQTKGSAWSLAGMYEAGPLYATLAYQANDFGSAGTGLLAGTANTNEKAWKLGASYKMDAFEGDIVYEKTSDDLGAACGGAAGQDCFGHRSWYLAGKYSFGSDAVKLAYTNAGNNNLAGNVVGAGANTGAKQVSIGYDHSFSKRTGFYALYTKLSNDTNAANGLTTAGSTGGTAVLGNDADPSAWSFGLKHSF
ncbi:MAG: porin [Pseudomonadota bacterium]